MRLTANFSLEELTRSTTAQRLRLDNTPPPGVLPQLQETAELLQRIREHLQRPIIVTSAYRGPEVNRAVGGVTSSDHTRGQAADIVVPSFGTPYQVAKALAPQVSVLGIGQLLLEQVGSKSWVHVSTRLPTQASNRVLTFDGRGYALGIQFVA